MKNINETLNSVVSSLVYITPLANCIKWFIAKWKQQEYNIIILIIKILMIILRDFKIIF